MTVDVLLTVANKAINHKNKGTLLLQLYKLLPLLLHKEGSKMLPGRENFTFCNEEAEIQTTESKKYHCDLVAANTANQWVPFVNMKSF